MNIDATENQIFNYKTQKLKIGNKIIFHDPKFACNASGLLHITPRRETYKTL